jgi:single-strand DNA-binding protein
MNSVQLIGNISSDIELKYTPNGHAVASFSLAVTNPRNRDKTSFIPVECWRKSAENLANFCKKGSKIGVVGIIEVDNYERDGQKRTFTKVSADFIQFLTPKSGGNSGNTSQKPNNNQGNSGNNPLSNDGQIDIADDDLPF